MELVYLYVEKYRRFSNAGFNFSSAIRFEYNEEDRLLKNNSDNSSLPDGFWGDNISNLVMIVGNNGSGKTSLMQYIIQVFQKLHYGDIMPGYGILALREEKNIYYCEFEKKSKELKTGFHDKRYKFIRVEWQEMEQLVLSLKIIYLTNALSQMDHQRNQRMSCDRYSLIYDCSVGGLIYADAQRDVNKELHQGPAGSSELETYFFYEQYKQIKFVFDKNQYRILQDMKKSDYPVPLPEVLYIDLLLDNQLRYLLDSERYDVARLHRLDERLFPHEWMEMQRQADIFNKDEIHSEAKKRHYALHILRYYLSCCCVWGMLSSIVRRFGEEQKEILWGKLMQWQVETNRKEFQLTSRRIWEMCEEIVGKHPVKDMKEWEIFREKCIPHYERFLEFVRTEPLMDYFRLEDSIAGILNGQGNLRCISLSISTDKAEWFMDFLKKYRYIANPDYFMDFHWGLSSGETNLLSMFAAFYYAFPNDYTNQEHGDYTIYNRTKHGEYCKCDDVIVLADEVDLTYHPEWQREYISLLTAFLTRIYPPSCCKNIQIILSTHSPILLGDVPQPNVIYLKYFQGDKTTKLDTEKHLGTFGQNVHLLFKDGFFLYKGTMGRFAHDKIRGYMVKLQELENEVDAALRENCVESDRDEYIRRLREFEKCVELIAEPIIQKKLFLLIDEIKGKLISGQQNHLNSLSDEMLEKQLELLQKERNRRKNDKNPNL